MIRVGLWGEFLMKIEREEMDRLLFESMRAMYQFERSKVAVFNLNYEAIYVLQFLRRRSSASMTELAFEMNLPVSSATRLVDQLQRSSFVSRKKDPGDGRVVLVALEPEGERIVQAVEDHSYKLIARNLESYGDDDLAAFVRTARNIKEILDS